MQPLQDHQAELNGSCPIEEQLLAIIRQRAASHPWGYADIEDCQQALGVSAPTLYALLSDLERRQAVDLGDMTFGVVRIETGPALLNEKDQA